MRQSTVANERQLMQQLQEERESESTRRSPNWVYDFWVESENDRIRRQLGFGLAKLAVR